MIYSLALGPNSIVIIHDTKITRIIAPKRDGTPPISNLVVIYSKSSFTLVALDFTFPLAC